MNSFAATGPVISVSCFSGGVMKVTPSPSASNVTLASPVSDVSVSEKSAEFR